MSQTKVLLVALDAAEKDLIRSWAAQGLLPAFRDLEHRSFSTVTAAPLGMHAGATWQSFVSGLNPARHGHCADRQLHPGSYQLMRKRPQDFKSEPFWHALSRAGRRVAVIDAPYLPADPDINGLQIIDWTSHSADTGFCTVPPSLAAEVKARFGRDEVGLCDDLHIVDAEEIASFSRALERRVRQKADLSKHYLGREEWDLFMVGFSEAHCIGHQCWHVHDRTHPRHDPIIADRVGNPLLPVYQALDSAVGTLIDAAGADARVFIVCTHGMGPNYTGAHLLHEILSRLGYGPPLTPTSRTWAGLRRWWRLLPPSVRQQLAGLQKAAVDRTWPPLDAGYQCFAVPNGEVYGGIRINLAGREPRGRVAAGAAYDALCDEIANGLRMMVSADDGKPIIGRVLRTADLYQGPYLGDLPDLLVEWTARAPLTRVYSEKTGTIERELPTRRSGHHRAEGMLFAAGPGIAPGECHAPMSIMDIAPTIGALLGVPLANVDGQPIAACLPPRTDAPVSALGGR